MIEGIVQRVDEVFTEEALAANDGKTIPLRLEPGGPIVGEITLKYDSEEKALRANFQVNDPKVAELLNPMPAILWRG